MSRRKKIFFLVIGGLGIVGVIAAFWIESYSSRGWPHLRSLPAFTTEKPKYDDVVGIYVLTKQTVTTNGLAVLGGLDCQLEFLSDGRFQATNYPVWINDQRATFVSATGHWQLAKVGTDHGRTTWGIRFLEEIPNIDMFEFVGELPVGLMAIHGDFDEGAVMIFKKK